MTRAGLTPYQALAAGTRNVAAFFGTLAETGTVAVGKRADLVLLAGNPLADIRQTARIAGVMLGGRWLARAELVRRVAALPVSERRWLYQWYTNEASQILAGTKRTRQWIERLVPMHQAERHALIDSLLAGTSSMAEHQRLIDLIARQLGEARALLPPDARASFDWPAREWLAKRGTEGYRVTFPEVSP